MLGYSTQLYIASVCPNSKKDTSKETSKCIDIAHPIETCGIICIIKDYSME